LRATQAKVKRYIALITLGFSLALVLQGCAHTPPLERLEAELASAPEYAIILEDMREEGTFFPSYYHRYRIVRGDTARTTDWLRVSESVYRAIETRFLNQEAMISMVHFGKGVFAAEAEVEVNQESTPVLQAYYQNGPWEIY
jgi:hypothetical protein